MASIRPRQSVISRRATRGPASQRQQYAVRSAEGRDTAQGVVQAAGQPDRAAGYSCRPGGIHNDSFTAGAGFVTIGLVLGGIELLLGTVVLVALSPMIMLRADAIRIWNGFRFTNVGISDIGGIGMLYAHTAGKGGYWRLFIWRDDGSLEGTGFAYLFGRGPRLAPGKGQSWLRQANYDPVASSELPALNASRAAAVGRDIGRRVLAAQGPDGQFATRHLDKHQPPIRLGPYTQLIAYWSPDGQTGHCR